MSFEGFTVFRGPGSDPYGDVWRGELNMLNSKASRPGQDFCIAIGIAAAAAEVRHGFLVEREIERDAPITQQCDCPFLQMVSVDSSKHRPKSRCA